MNFLAQVEEVLPELPSVIIDDEISAPQDPVGTYGKDLEGNIVELSGGDGKLDRISQFLRNYPAAPANPVSRLARISAAQLRAVLVSTRPS